jgi:hypothetical protein
VRKEWADADGYESFACPGQGEHPHLNCPTPAGIGERHSARSPCLTLGSIHSRSAPSPPYHRPRHWGPAPSGPGLRVARVGSHQCHLPQHHRGHQGYAKDTAHESLASPGRRRPARHRRPEPLRRPAPHGRQLPARLSPTGTLWPRVKDQKWPSGHGGAASSSPNTYRRRLKPSDLGHRTPTSETLRQ